jgi:PhnB protein
MQVQPYLSFEGRCEEAVEYYRNALGAEVEALMRFKEMPEPGDSEMCAPVDGEKIMHSCFRIGDTRLMATDGMCTGKASFEGISLSLSVPDDATAERLFSTLADGGQVQVPLAKTFFASSFGMVADRFGVSWMIVAGPEGQ